MLFLNAVMTISVFSVGFLLATFSLLWFGSSLLTRSTEVAFSYFHFNFFLALFLSLSFKYFCFYFCLFLVFLLVVYVGDEG